jgi:predicted nucleic acid-binding Zn ribbon protein
MKNTLEAFREWQRNDIERLKAIRLKQEAREKHITLLSWFFVVSLIAFLVLLTVCQPK